ncbi:hypothetical protein JCGZ_05517 [Jatropha curcas]|uniref:Uncharacterized protein n=1 Tax=Jatropha curcas TaxID=180498 RepID=A0A067LHH4_JATCU|nr:hypothetical protein JCGZ_05517 [Jatropha curcas]
MKFATDVSVAKFRALKARRPPSSFFFFLSSPPPLLSSVRSAAPALPDAAPARLTPPAPLCWNSGTSGASSSAQRPVLPPSDPSAPYSSSPVSRPVQSPPAAQSPTVQASADPCISLSLVAGHIYPPSRVARQIMRIIKLQLHKEGYTWDAVPQEARDFYWEEFQPEHTPEEFTELWVRVDDQQRQITELRAHVMLLSGELGAGDTLVTPSGTTAHPAGTHPGDSTSDRADEQPRTFDFGPF